MAPASLKRRRVTAAPVRAAPEEEEEEGAPRVVYAAPGPGAGGRFPSAPTAAAGPTASQPQPSLAAVQHGSDDPTTSASGLVQTTTPTTAALRQRRAAAAAARLGGGGSDGGGASAAIPLNRRGRGGLPPPASSDADAAADALLEELLCALPGGGGGGGPSTTGPPAASPAAVAGPPSSAGGTPSTGGGGAGGGRAGRRRSSIGTAGGSAGRPPLPASATRLGGARRAPAVPGSARPSQGVCGGAAAARPSAAATTAAAARGSRQAALLSLLERVEAMVGGGGGGGGEAAAGAADPALSQCTAPQRGGGHPPAPTPPPQTVGPAPTAPAGPPSPDSVARREAALEAEFEAAMGGCGFGGGDGGGEGDAVMAALLAEADAAVDAARAAAASARATAATAAAAGGDDENAAPPPADACCHPPAPVTGEAGPPGRAAPAPPTGCAEPAAASDAPPPAPPAPVNPAARPARFIVLEVAPAAGAAHGLDVRLLAEDGGSGLFLRLRGPWADADLAPGEAVALSSLLPDGRGGAALPPDPPGTAPTVGVPTRPVPVSGGGPGGEPAWTCGAGTGLLVTRPDLLLSGTRVAGSLRCVRQSALEEKFGGEPGRAAAVGTLTHEVLAAALTDEEAGGSGGAPAAGAVSTVPAAGTRAFTARLEAAADEASRRAPDRLLEVGLDEASAAAAARAAVPAIAAFVQSYLPAALGGGGGAGGGGGGRPPAPVRGGGGPSAPCAAAITAVRDVEEVVWAPAVGIKGVLDATVAVDFFTAGGGGRTLQTTTTRTPCAPFEFKTGKRHGSHRAQVSLYLALAASRYGAPGPPAGLLWYSGDPVPEAVLAHGGEAASLVCGRNALAGALNPRSSRTGSGGGALVVDAPMLRDPRACGGCFQGAACAAVHAAVEGGSPASAGLAPGAFEALVGHLTPPHAAFLAHWLRLLDEEEAAGGARRAEIWTLSGAEREGRGRAAAGLALADSVPAGAGAWLHTFVRAAAVEGGGGCNATAVHRPLDEVGLSAGDMAVVGLDGAHPCVSRGTVVGARPGALVVRTDRRLRADLAGPSASASWRVDRDEPSTAFVRQRRALLALFRRDDAAGGGADAARLRRLVVELAPPSAGGRRGLAGVEARLAATLAASGELGGTHDAEPLPAACPVPPPALAAALASLNPDQRAAVDAALRAREYALILGLPGTGKTAATVAAVAAAVACGARVLVASYTNAAVDNVMLRLADLGVAGLLRVGRAAGVHPGVRRFLPGGDPASGAATPRPTAADLAAAAAGAPVVGATVLGCEHALVKLGGRFDLVFVDEAGQVRGAILERWK